MKNVFGLVGWGGLLLLSACASVAIHRKPFEVLSGSAQHRVVVSHYEPHPEYVCKSLGFLPCSLNSENIKSDNPNQCAVNLLPYVEKIEANFIYLEKPLQALGINWRDSKANVYHCLYVPQPMGNNPNERLLKPDKLLPPTAPAVKSDPSQQPSAAKPSTLVSPPASAVEKSPSKPSAPATEVDRRPMFKH